MTSGIHFSIPAAGSIVAGVVLLGVAWKMSSFEQYPGWRAWLLTLLGIAVWDISYGIALAVFDPTLRMWLEPVILVGRVLTIPVMLVFALQYTGREKVVRSVPMGIIIGLFLGGWLLAVTNPFHHLMWADYQIQPVFGSAAVSYQMRGYQFLNLLTVLTILVVIGLFTDTFTRYRDVYGRQVIALLLALVLPSATLVLWIFRLGPTQHLDLTPIMHIASGTLVTYALFREEMFEVVPATQYKAQTVAVNELDAAVITVTIDAKIIEVNDVAAELLGEPSDSVVLAKLEEYFSIDVPPKGDSKDVITNPFGYEKTYSATVSEITNDSGDAVGYIISLQDISEERLRQQRLAVLQRVLRHNLRNKLNVSLLLLDRIKKDNELENGHIDSIAAKLEDVVGLSNKVREAEGMVSENESGSLLTLNMAIERALDDVDVPDECEIETDLQVQGGRIDATAFAPVITELVGNGIKHNDAVEPVVHVRTKRVSHPTHPIEVVVSDNGPGIPSHELEPLREGDESSLSHGSGIGLWLVKWGVSQLQGRIAFDVENPVGTRVTIRLPEADVS